MTSTSKHTIAIRATAFVAIAFGLLTLKEGGAVIFGDAAARAAAGDYVPFVVWFNFLAGFAYVIAGIGLWMRQRWAGWLAISIAAATALAFAAFGLHMLSGGAYELRTAFAMGFRTLVWSLISVVAWRQLLRRSAAVPGGVA